MGNVLNDFLLFFVIGYRKMCSILICTWHVSFFLITIFDFLWESESAGKKIVFPQNGSIFNICEVLAFFFILFFLFLLSAGENWRSLIKEVFSGLFGDFKRSIDLVRGNQSLLNSNLNWNVKAQIKK